MSLLFKIANARWLVALPLLVFGTSLLGQEKDETVRVRVAAYNVEYGDNATPEQIAEMFKPYKLDIIGFNEVPDGGWTERVGKILGMKHSYVGKVSSANHKDKHKSILSKTPLTEKKEHELRVEHGWNPASVVRAETEIDGVSIVFYSLHICRSRDMSGHAYKLAAEILPKEDAKRVIISGDFNNKMEDGAMNAIEASGMRLTWKDLKIDIANQSTFNALDPSKNLGVIDHILYKTSPKVRATKGGIIELDKALSDHKPVWAEIEFPRMMEKPSPQK